MQVARELNPARYGPAVPAIPGRVASPPGHGSRRQPREARQEQPALRPRVALWLGGAALWCAVVAVGIVTVQYHAEAARRSARVGELEAEAARVEQENRDLRARVSELSSMQRIEREARRLGLVKPGELRVVAVDPAAVPPEHALRAPAPEPEAPGGNGRLWDRLRALAGSIRIAHVPPGAATGQ